MYPTLLQAPDNDRYEVSWIDIYVEKLENYNWNFLDFYTCTRGDRDYPLRDIDKFWRIQLYVLPSAGYKELSRYTQLALQGPLLRLVPLGDQIRGHTGVFRQ